MSGASRAVVLLSGGIDSTAALWEAKEQGREAIALFVAYGQLAEVLEEERSGSLAAQARVPFFRVPVRGLCGGVTGWFSVLSDDRAATIVPYRNLVLLGLGANRAAALGASEVWIGCTKDDGVVYPDCGPEFLMGLEAGLKRACPESPLRIVAPWIQSTKAEVVARARALGCPIARAYSCYRGTDPACGACHACRSREEALRAGLPGE